MGYELVMITSSYRQNQTRNWLYSVLYLFVTHVATYITTLYMYTLDLYTNCSWSCTSLVLALMRSYSRCTWSLTVSIQILLVHYSVVIYSKLYSEWKIFDWGSQLQQRTRVVKSFKERRESGENRETKEPLNDPYHHHPSYPHESCITAGYRYWYDYKLPLPYLYYHTTPNMKIFTYAVWSSSWRRLRRLHL